MNELKTTQDTNLRLCLNTGNILTLCVLTVLSHNRQSSLAALFGEQYSLAMHTVDNVDIWVFFILWVVFIL